MDQAQFFIACLIQALEDVHRQGVIHLDVKPSSLIFESTGYTKLTNFGLAQKKRAINYAFGNNEKNLVTQWTAPEVVTSSKGFSFEADYWSVGVVAYQLMLGGDLPFIGKDFDEVKQAHASHDICLKTSDVPVGWSWQAADFINKCLQKRPEKRIGIHRGSKELKQHPWFDDFDWQAL